jgi:hypothetical protein
VVVVTACLSSCCPGYLQMPKPLRAMAWDSGAAAAVMVVGDGSGLVDWRLSSDRTTNFTSRCARPLRVWATATLQLSRSRAPLY